jgi:hypothetical protein
MKTEEWRTVDKSTWGEGEWQREPDKKQWQDAETGLPCLIVRNNGGALCGYVGVPPGHPWHGKDYSDCTLPTAKPRGRKPRDDEPLPGSDLKMPTFIQARMAAKLVCKEEYCQHSPESILEVHGGVTFAAPCAAITREAWERWRAQLLARKDEAKQYPVGDAAGYFREWGSGLESFDQWAEMMRARAICHLPDPGEPDKVYWFGFDCSHAGDLTPGYKSLMGSMLSERSSDRYRPIAYVERQCAELAKQLAAIRETGRLKRRVRG